MAGATITAGSALLPSVHVSQATVMIGSLVGGFVLYLALNNRLAVYWGLLLGGTATAAPADPPGSVAVPIPPATQ